MIICYVANYGHIYFVVGGFMKGWFKNSFSYRITERSKIYTSDEIGEKIVDGAIAGFAGGQLEKVGFGKVIGDDYFFAINDKCFLFSLQIDKKDIPKKIVDGLVNEANKAYRLDNGKPMSKNELIICREDIIDQLLPKAFIKTSNIMGYIDYENMLFVVDASSPNKFDLFSSKLREVLSNLSFQIINPDVNVSGLMGSWLMVYDVVPYNSNVSVDDSFTIGEFCIMKQVVESKVATISLNNKHLDDDDIRNHITNGAVVESLMVNWESKINFVLNANFRLTKIEGTELVSDLVDDSLGDYDQKGLENDEGLYREYKRVSLGLMVKSFAEIQDSLIKLFSK